MFCDHNTVRLTVDSGATGDMIRASIVTRLGASIRESSQSATQADGSSPLDVIGEVHFTFVRYGRTFTLDGLVLNELDVEDLAGAPFMELNDVSVRPAKFQVILDLHLQFRQRPYNAPHGTALPGTSCSTGAGEVAFHQTPRERRYFGRISKSIISCKETVRWFSTCHCVRRRRSVLQTSTSLLPDVDSTLRLIATWKHIVNTDCTKAYYQISSAKNR